MHRTERDQGLTPRIDNECASANDDSGTRDTGVAADHEILRERDMDSIHVKPEHRSKS